MVNSVINSYCSNGIQNMFVATVITLILLFALFRLEKAFERRHERGHISLAFQCGTIVGIFISIVLLAGCFCQFFYTGAILTTIRHDYNIALERYASHDMRIVVDHQLLTGADDKADSDSYSPSRFYAYIKGNTLYLEDNDKGMEHINDMLNMLNDLRSGRSVKTNENEHNSMNK